jgi:hypothetical protein
LNHINEKIPVGQQRKHHEQKQVDAASWNFKNSCTFINGLKLDFPYNCKPGDKFSLDGVKFHAVSSV